MADRILKIMEEEWNYLIILDACRYDYFARQIGNYFSGKLEKASSLGYSTLEWLKKNFPGYYPDVVYISGNPYIHSKLEVGGFDAKKHFYEVVDVWQFGWDEMLGTVPPRRVNEASLNLIRRFPEKRFIIHFMQPHAPYISVRFSGEGYPTPFTQGILRGVRGYRSNKIIKRLANLLGDLLSKAKLIRSTLGLRQTLGLPPAGPMDVVRRKYGVDGLREAYQENLQVVLGRVAELCREISRISQGEKIVITADHGELLGEHGKYSHGIRDRLVTEVPWFEIENVQSVVAAAESLESSALPAYGVKKEEVRDKIRRLRESGKL